MDDYDKILNDYINQESDDKSVVSFSEHGNEIRIRYTNNIEDDYRYEMTISLLDLIVFVYSLTPKRL